MVDGISGDYDIHFYINTHGSFPFAPSGSDFSGLSWNSSDSYNPIDGFNAKGLNTVPYDNYIARLHRGEQVLTASQARRRKEGGMDISSLSSAVAGAIREAMENVTVNSYLSGRAVTEDVNRNTIREVKARRFAT